MSLKPIGVFVSVQIKNPNFNSAGLVLSKAAQQSKEVEPKGKLTEVGDKCEWLNNTHIGKTVYFRSGAVVEVLGTDKDEYLQCIMAETSIHCYADNDGVV